MADAPAPASSKGFDLTQKLGPLPLWAWLGAAAGIWWYLQRQQAAGKAGAPGQQTDPAGNVGSIDPASGYVYGSPEDQAALAAASAGSSSAGTSAGTNATTGAQKYADNNTWGIAAVNYLVGLGIDGVTANQAVQNYLSSQPLTTAEQGDVNLAIQSLGAPPSLPGPVTTSPPPVTTPPGGTAGSKIIMSLPDGSGGWEQVTFPDQAAVDAWNSWNANFASAHGGRTQAYRSEWNTELTSLGAVGTSGPLKPPSGVTGNPNDAR